MNKTQFNPTLKSANQTKNHPKVPKIRFKNFNDTWEQRKLGELGSITTGSTPSTSVTEYYSPDGMLWVTPTDICENVTHNTEKKLSKLGQQVGRVVPKNTILVTCIASIGKNTMLGDTGSFNQQINGLTPNESKYEPYFLLTESALWSAQMKRSAAAGTMQIVNRTEFSELATLVPCMQEQRKIADMFRNLDTLITLHQRKYDQLVNIKKSMLEKMFPKNGELVPEVRFAGFTGLWEQRKLGELSDITTGKLDANAMTPDGEYDFYTCSLQVYKIDKYAFEGPAITVAGNGYVGCLHLADGKFNAYQRTYVLSNFKAIREYLYAEIGNKLPAKVNQEARNGNIPYIVLDMLTDLEVSLPCEEEQRKLADLFTRLDTLITLHQRKLEKLKNIKKAMLERMFVS